MCRPLRCLVLFFFGFFVLSACTDKNSAGHSASESDVEVSRISFEDSVVHAGHSFSLTYDVAAREEKSGVAVTFYLANKEERDSAESDRDVEHTEILGSDSVDIGEGGETMTRYPSFMAPKNLPDGEYYLRAYVNDSENTVTADETVIVSNADSATPNLKVLGLKLKDNTVVLDPRLDMDSGKFTNLTTLQNNMALTPEELNRLGKGQVSEAEINGFVNIACEGALPVQPVQLKFQVRLNGTWTDLEWWVNSAHAYASTVPINFPGYEEGSTVQGMDMDINIPESVMSDMMDMLSSLTASLNPNGINTFDVRVIVDPANLIAELNEDDNTFELSVRIYSLPESDAKSASSAKGALDTDRVSEKEWSRSSGDSDKISIGAEYSHKFALYNGNPREGVYGAYGKTEFAIPLILFNNRFDLINAYFRAASYVDKPETTGYKYSVTYLENTLVSKENWSDLYPAVSREFSWEKEKTLVKTRFTVGPIPFSVSLGIKGEVGYSQEFGVKADGVYAASTMPGLEFDLVAKGGPDIDVASAGIVSNLGLIDDELTTRFDLSFSFDDDQGFMVAGQFDVAVVNDLKTIWGEFGLYGKVWPMKTPEYLWIYNTDPYREWTYTLYSVSETLFQ